LIVLFDFKKNQPHTGGFGYRPYPKTFGSQNGSNKSGAPPRKPED
jgi:hypothetical protein